VFQARRILFRGAVAGLLVLVAALVVDLGDVVRWIAAGVAFCCAMGWAWFNMSAQVQEAADALKDCHSKARRDIEQ
jgi:lysylphosphatidylglycerol synthetase-like protein (DUF2156 family)